MAIKPQSIRKGVIVKFDNVDVDKQTVRPYYAAVLITQQLKAGFTISTSFVI